VEEVEEVENEVVDGLGDDGSAAVACVELGVGLGEAELVTVLSGWGEGEEEAAARGCAFTTEALL